MKISRLRIFLAKPSRFGGYIYHSKVPYESIKEICLKKIELRLASSIYQNLKLGCPIAY